VSGICQPVALNSSGIPQLSPLSSSDLAANGSISLQSSFSSVPIRHCGVMSDESRLALGHEMPASITDGKLTDTRMEGKLDLS
jgi:hypothetical protein